jgi:hypothetical protein
MEHLPVQRYHDGGNEHRFLKELVGEGICKK